MRHLALLLATAAVACTGLEPPAQDQQHLAGPGDLTVEADTRAEQPVDRPTAGHPCEYRDCTGEAVGPVAIPLATCDSDYAGLDWHLVATPHFNIRVLPDTAAFADLDEIIAVREAAYDHIATAIGLTERPAIDLFMSPSRTAAIAHGASPRRAWPAYQRYDVTYTGDPDSFEVQRYGHELAHVLLGQLEKPRPFPLPILDEGLAEYFDQSGRDLHDAYAQLLNTDLEHRRYPAWFEPADLTGKHHGRAGSLVQTIIERHSLRAALHIYTDTHLDWTSGCYRHPDVPGCIDTPKQLALVLDAALARYTSDRWADLQHHWDDAVRTALQRTTAIVDRKATAQIANLVALMDQAINDKNADIYLTTMDAHHCDLTPDPARAAIATRTVTAYDDVQSRVLAIYPTGMGSHTSAYALIQRTEGRGITSVMGVQLERINGMWRQTESPDWH